MVEDDAAIVLKRVIFPRESCLRAATGLRKEGRRKRGKEEEVRVASYRVEKRPTQNVSLILKRRT